VSVRSSLQCVDRKYHTSFEYSSYILKHGTRSRPLFVFGSRARRGTITIRGTHDHASLMEQQFAIQHTTLMKKQFVITHKIRQTEVPALLDRWLSHSFCQNVMSEKKRLVFPYIFFHVLMICKLFSVSNKIVYPWATTYLPVS
jgi:hypothetical protein